MTEHEALTKIQELIYNYFGCDPMYYANSATAKLCCQINEIASAAEKKLYVIFYEQYFFGDQYNKYVKFVDSYDIFHEVGELIYHSTTAVKNIRWCELSDETITDAEIRFEKDGLWEPTVKRDVMRRTEKQ